MPVKLRRPCNYPRCPKLSDAAYCEDHRKQVSKERGARKQADETWQLYQTPQWKKFRAWFIKLNPICQRIIDGKQCMNWATLIHHRKAVRTHQHLLTLASNCVGLCADHHSNHEGDRGDEVYTRTEEGIWGLYEDAQ
jgi:5-methylcytosine-specific restriction enzyme A